MDTQIMLDSLWVIVAAALVFFMHAGFALVESGFARRKNVVMVLMKNVGVVAVASIVYWAVGYGFMFGEGNPFIGLSLFFPDGADVGGAADMVGTLPRLVFVFFQLVFAATACTIVSGAIAERGKLGTFFVFTVLATAFVYPIVGHWVWGGGWLAEMGFADFAGSTVVHAVGGGMALAGAIAIGPRLGKYQADGSVKPMPAHSFPLAALGVIILWLGWFGFNGGSTVAISDPGLVAKIILVTNLAASAGFIGALAWNKFRTGGLDLSMALNGALGGLVGITAGCDVIAPHWALVVGVLGGILCVEGVFFLDKVKIDDPVGAVAVHGICGIYGTLAVGIFGTGKGILAGGEIGQLGVQAIGTLAGFGFAFVVGMVFWKTLGAIMGVRVSAEDELEGLDRSECGVDAYGVELSGVSTASESHGSASLAAQEA
ncbi:MAG: ammonium transporter [Myxococcales bacterium]|nr:ammonium transporter [Myxococcales bacterium]